MFVVRALFDMKMTFFEVLVLTGFHVPAAGGCMRTAQRIVCQGEERTCPFCLDILSA